MRKPVGYIEDYFDYGIDVVNRQIYIGTNYQSQSTGVDYLMAERVIKALSILDVTSGGIRLIMNNEGGFWYDGIAMFDYIRNCKNTITMDVYGQAFSMGAVMLQAADHRRMSKHAKVMLHYGVDGIESTHPEIYRRWAKESLRVKKEMEDIFLERMSAKNPSITRRQLKEMLDFDTVLSARQAEEQGLIDEVI